ncbi:hypothetical protein P7C73_g3209, partial [Tremellales sp. Uapishka_1]
MQAATVPLLSKEGVDVPQESLDRPPRGTRAPIGKIALRLIVASLCGLLLFAIPYRLSLHGNVGSHHIVQLESCPSAETTAVDAPRSNIWRNIDIPQAAALRSWLMDHKRGLNLTEYEKANDSDNFIHFVEAYKPRKDDALAYLSNGTEVPAKYAHAVIHHGVQELIADYLVGPLPISELTTIRPIKENYHNDVPLNARCTFNWAVIGQFMKQVFEPMDDITRDLFNGSVFDNTLVGAGTAPMSYDGSWRRSWLQLRRNVPGSWLHGVDFYVYVDFSGNSLANWKVLSIIHDKQKYDSIAAIRQAWEEGRLKKHRSTKEDQSDWATRSIKGKKRELDDRAGPRSVEFDGKRYKVDFKEDWISWMGWELFIGFERDMGVHLWDINFRGERIIYELSPQEAMAQYSGDDPHQAATVWLDRAFGMGGLVRSVILGYDCPYHSTLLNATVHEAGSRTIRNAICVFERETGRPLSRHTGFAKDEMGAVKGYELVIRSISTVGNYDYFFDYTFQLDGTIEIRVSASGYLQGGVWNDGQGDYGHQLQRTAMGSLHDHVINFKVDFDIAGTKNSFMEVKLETEKRVEDWFEDDWGSTVIQQKIARDILAEESLLDYPKNMEGAYVVINEDEKNAWGNPRGYTIHPGPLVHLTNLDAKRTEKNVNWAKHHLAVSRRKETEPSSSSTWNINLPGAPPVDFYKFFDNETIQGEDLVVWVNLGTHHIPRSEDSPNTLTNIATSYVLLAPWNYNDYDVSMESRNSILLNQDGEWQIKEGVEAKECAPPPLPRMEYHSPDSWKEDGTPVPEQSEELQRFLSEQLHGLRAI